LLSFQFFNILGKLVKETLRSVDIPGTYFIVFDGANLSSGIYFIRVQVRISDSPMTYLFTQKMILLK